MHRKHYLFLALLFSLFSVNAQTGSKLDMHLQNRLKQGKVTDGSVALLVKGDPDKIKALTQKMDGIYKYGFGKVASVSIPTKNVYEFSCDASIEKIQSTWAKGIALMDTARIRNNIDSAQAGFAPLQDSVLGKNVIVGIIDGGIYWQHKDFKNADGSTRILYIWDQTATGNAPPPYQYGVQYSSHDINAGTCGEVEPYGQTSCPSDFGHGTCVAGIASGNGSSMIDSPFLAGVYTGVAPQSNLIVVNIGTQGTETGCEPSGIDFLTQVSDAVDYIFEKANALGMPCVINISQGTYYGSHDGIDITSEIIDSLLEQSKGRVVVAAAGNAGNIPYHLAYNVPSDSTNPAYTFFDYSQGEVYFDLWADTANFNNVQFTVGLADNLGDSLGQIPYMNVLTNFSSITAANPVGQYSATMNNGTIPIGDVEVQVTLDEGRYHVEFLVSGPTNTTDLWSLKTYGSGNFDLWASSSLIGSSNIVNFVSTIPGDTTFFTSPNYRFSDLNKTIVSSWQCSNDVITVGNYSNRAGYWDVDSNYINLTSPAYGGEVVGQRFITSSFGPTRDNRLKPDIAATGSTILCTGDANDIAVTLNPSNRYKVALGGKHLRNGGTSMSSPIVAGIAALYFQLHPNATFEEIKQALICTAVQDSFTGAVPNNAYGYGKVNAYQALINTVCAVYGALDTTCINYNPLANIDTGGCIAKVYGCRDPLAANYDSLANVSGDSCIYTSIVTVANAQIAMKVIPNPFSGQTTFSIFNNGYSFKVGSIEITNALGEKVDEISISPNTANYLFDNPGLAAGIYFYMLKLDNKVIKTGKLVAQ
jgi:subtilisin family serine protease